MGLISELHLCTNKNLNTLVNVKFDAELTRVGVQPGFV